MLRFVLSITPGNFFALKTWKTSEKALARTGAEPVLSPPPSTRPTLTKFIFNLCTYLVQNLKPPGGGATAGRNLYLNAPSVLTDRSCKMNHTPILLSGSVSLNALALKLPIKFLVNMPEGVCWGGCCGGPCMP